MSWLEMRFWDDAPDCPRRRLFLVLLRRLHDGVQCWNIFPIGRRAVLTSPKWWTPRSAGVRTDCWIASDPTGATDSDAGIRALQHDRRVPQHAPMRLARPRCGICS